MPPAQQFRSVSICLTDIVGFTKLASEATALQVSMSIEYYALALFCVLDLLGLCDCCSMITLYYIIY